MNIPIHNLEISERNKINFWNKVDKNGPLPDQSNPHYAGLGQCWVWKASCDSNGYGIIAIQRRMRKAHRVSWMISFGDALENMCVCHRCDNPLCINPQHLFLGTLKDNAQDRESKGRGNQLSGDDHPLRKDPSRAARGDANGARVHRDRMPRGERNGTILHPECLLRGEDNNKAKLTAEQVVTIRLRHATGEKCANLANEFGVCYTNIRRIVTRTTWAHVP